MSRTTRRRRSVLEALVATGIVASVLAVGAPSGAVIDAVPPAEPPVVDTVVLDAKSSTATSTHVPLVQDRDYVLEVSGTYGHGGGLADAECSTTVADSVLRPSRPNTYGEGLFDVMVDLTVVEWVPIDPDDEGCDESGDNRYRYIFHASQTAPLTLQIADTYFKDNSGSLNVDVYVLGQPVPQTELLDTFTVNSASTIGASTPSLTAGQHYLLRASGTYVSDRTQPRVHDPECTSFQGLPGVRDVSTQNATDDYFDLYVDSSSVAWQPANASPTGCDDTSHTYELRYDATANGPVNVRVVEPFVRDNQGTLTVEVHMVTSQLPDAAVPPEHVFDQVVVPANKAQPTSTNVPLRAGTAYTLEASGTWFWGSGFADAECANTLQDGAYLRDRFDDLIPGVDLFDLDVNGTQLEWEAPTPNPDGCSDAHVYRASFTPSADGALSLRVNDTWHPNNWGSITVKVFLAPVPDPETLLP